MKLSFVIPCYGSEKTIKGVVDEITETMGQRPQFDYEIIAVNDGSPDNVLSVLKELAVSDDKLFVADLSKNMGKHSAVMAGFSLVTGDFVVCLDDDGQCPANELWRLFDALGDDYDVAMAKYPEVKQSRFKNIGSEINSLMTQWLLDKPKELHFSNFLIMRRYVIDEMLRYGNPYPYLEGLILRTTRRIVCVEMEERGRSDAGSGNFTLKRSLSLWMNGFTAFSVKPLRLSAFIGFVFAITGFIFGLYIIIRKIIHPEILMGYSSTMAAIFFIGGVLMIMLGFVGEYIGRIYISINNSPQYVIRKIYNKSDQK